MGDFNDREKTPLDPIPLLGTGTRLHRLRGDPDGIIQIFVSNNSHASRTTAGQPSKEICKVASDHFPKSANIWWYSKYSR